MNNLRFQIEKIFKGAGNSFSRFPVATISALVVSITAFVRITMEWEAQQTYALLFDSIQIAFVLGAVSSMALVIFDEVKGLKDKSNLILANSAGMVLALISFLLLYFYGGRAGEDKVLYLSSIAMARMSAAIFVSIVAFIYWISKAKSVDSFSDSFFITHRAFIISAIYGLVIMIGVSGVIGAFQALVYKGLDHRIYQYLGVIVGFLTYTIFLGYFPSFRGIENKAEIDSIEEQPRFIYVLLENIITPIIMALTVVLLIWSVRVLLKGIDVSFNQLSGIASAYVLIGIWLHIMLAKHESNIANFYKKAYPFAGVLILIFEAWALFVQLNKLGLRTTEYSFLMLWIFAIVSVLLLIFLNEKAYRKIAIAAVLVSIIWVLPFVGYADITFNSQVNRLEKSLIDQELLVGGKIVTSNKELDRVKRGEITEAVDFISYSEKENTPDWFAKNLENDRVFKDTFGFEKTYGVYDEPNEYNSIVFRLKEDVIDISEYSLSLGILPDDTLDTMNNFKVEGKDYELMISSETRGIPKITVKSEGKILAEESMKTYINDLEKRYAGEENTEHNLAFEDMNFVIQAGDIEILLVINTIEAYFNQGMDTNDYYVNLIGIYIK